MPYPFISAFFSFLKVTIEFYSVIQIGCKKIINVVPLVKPLCAIYLQRIGCEPKIFGVELFQLCELFYRFYPGKTWPVYTSAE